MSVKKTFCAVLAPAFVCGILAAGCTGKSAEDAERTRKINALVEWGEKMAASIAANSRTLAGRDGREAVHQDALDRERYDEGRLDAALKAFGEQVDRVVGNNAKLAAALRRLENENDDLKRDLAAAKRRNERLAAANARLENRLRRFERDFAEVEKSFAAEQSRSRELRGKCQDILAELTRTQEALAVARNELAKVEANKRNAAPAAPLTSGISPAADVSGKNWETAVGEFVKRVCDQPSNFGGDKTSAVFRLDVAADGRISNVTFINCRGRVREDYKAGVRNRLIGKLVPEAPGVRTSIEVELESE